MYFHHLPHVSQNPEGTAPPFPHPASSNFNGVAPPLTVGICALDLVVRVQRLGLDLQDSRHSGFT